MNKYQEALKVIDKVLSNLPSIHEGKEMDMTDLDLDHDGYEYELQTIKELVDKETPMKPVKRDKSSHDQFSDLCPICKTTLLYKGSGCQNNNCRQKVDWSNE